MSTSRFFFARSRFLGAMERLNCILEPVPAEFE